MLNSKPNSGKMRARPDLVAAILKEGSWEDDQMMRQLWAGMLASSCGPERAEPANMELVQLFKQLTPSQARIFVEGCRLASWQTAVKEGGAAASIIITSEEMVRVTGMHDLNRNAADVANLHEFGLVVKNLEFSTYMPLQSFNITPTQLGMQLFNACRGHLLANAVFHRAGTHALC
jgi:hypothetical protein